MKKNMILNRKTSSRWSALLGLLALSAAPIAHAVSSPGSGEIAIYTTAGVADGPAIATATNNNTTNAITHDFAAANVREDVGSFTRSGTDITLNRDGRYLAIYNSQFSSTGGTNRSEMQTFLELDGTPVANSWSQGYIRRTGGANDCVATGAAILNATSGDVLKLRTFRTDDNGTGLVTRLGGQTGLQLIKLDDIDMSYAQLGFTAAPPALTAAFQDLPYDNQIELDAGAFSNAAGALTLTSGGKYIVVANTYVAGGNARNTFAQQLTLDGTEVTGSKTVVYIRGTSANSCGDGAAALGMIIDATPGQVLRVQAKTGKVDATQPVIDGGRSVVSVIKLPSGGEYIRADQSSDQNVSAAAERVLTFDNPIDLDSAFSHTPGTVSPANGTVTVNTPGDYLFFGSVFENDGTSTRTYYHQGWQVSGSAREIYGQSGRYHRNADDGSGYGLDYGNFSGFIGDALLATNTVEMVSTRLGAALDDNANRVALQGVLLDSLFNFAASFEVIVAPTGVALAEGGATATYDISLGLAPASGSVEITVTSDAQTEVSLDGTTFTPTVAPSFTAGGVAQTITVRAIDDGDIESAHSGTITHAVTTTSDATNYPLSTVISSVNATITDNDVVAVNAIDDASTINVSEDGMGSEANLAPQPNLLANDTNGLNNVISASDSTSAFGAAVKVLADGTFTYDPTIAPGAQSLAGGDSGVDTFDYTAMDGDGNTDTATVSITVDGANDAPEAVNDRLFDGPLNNGNFTSTADLTDNDGAYRTVTTSFTFPPGSDLRLLPGKIVTQSPSVGTPPGNPAGIPENAFDGNIGTYTHTQSNNNGVNHSWQVDLGQVASLENVTLANRNDCCGVRLRDITVRVLDGGGTEIFNSGALNIANALGFTGGATETLFVDFAGPIMGQTVIVDRATDLADGDAGNGSILSLSEVTLIGSVVGTQTQIDDQILLNYDASQTAGTGRWENLGAGGGTAADWIFGSGVTLNSSVTSSRAQISAAYEWDGTTSATGILDGVSPNAIFGASVDQADTSIEFWTKLDAADMTQISTLFETGGGTGVGIVVDNGTLRVANGTNVAPIAYDLVGDPSGVLGGFTPTNEFFQVLMVMDFVNDLSSLYVNGQLVGTAANSTTDWDGGDASGMGHFQGNNHGGFQSPAAGTLFDTYLNGSIAKCRFYSTALNAAQVFQNFRAVNGDTDIDGDTISATGVIDGTGTFVANGTQATLASGALVTMNNATGGFDYDPNGVFTLLPGDTATDTFAYRVTDGNGGSAEANVTLTITETTIQQDWRLLYYGDIANSGPGADSAIATNGLTNLQSFAFDLDPTTVAGVLDVNAGAGTITSVGPPTIWTDPATNRIYLRHTRRTDFAAIPLTITDQFGRDLAMFEDSAVAPTMIATGTGDSGAAIEAVQTEFPFALPIGGGKGRYGRVNVTTP